MNAYSGGSRLGTVQVRALDLGESVGLDLGG